MTSPKPARYRDIRRRHEYLRGRFFKSLNGTSNNVHDDQPSNLATEDFGEEDRLSLLQKFDLLYGHQRNPMSRTWPNGNVVETSSRSTGSVEKYSHEELSGRDAIREAVRRSEFVAGIEGLCYVQ